MGEATLKVQVRLFSVAKEMAGMSSTTMELPSGARADDVLKSLSGSNARFADWGGSIRLAVNHEYVPADHLLQDGDEVAVIPPVSGG